VSTRVLLGVLLLAGAGCTHAAEFVHESPEAVEVVGPALPRPLSLTLATVRGTDTRLARKVANALRAIPGVQSVVAAGSGQPSDYEVELLIDSRPMSRGTNFPIAWPGFIIFTPAWHGFEWPYRVNTRVVVKRADGTILVPIQRSDLYTAYYTSDAYGIATGAGWIPFFYSIPAFVTGIVASFAPEERALREQFLLREGDDWGDEVAREIRRALFEDSLAPLGPPPAK
jgi:hypothetical protein